MRADTTTSTEPVVEPETAALGTRNLTRRFSSLVAVDDVTLGVPEGELRAIIGPNGAGKTTLFNLITASIEPSVGTIHFQGRDVTETEQFDRPHMGMARSFQSNQLFAEQTVLENVRVICQIVGRGSFGFDLFRNGRNVGQERAFEVLETVGMTDQHDATAADLSHGDQRRLGIAMALATDPKVLLLDEPTSGMGPAESNKTVEFIETVREELGLTVLLIEHDMDIVLSMSDRITVLDRGAVLATGVPLAIQDDDAVQEAYLSGMGEKI